MLDGSADILFEAKMRRGMAIGLAIGAIVSLATGILNWRNIRVEAEDADWVSHTYMVMNALRSATAGTVDLHTGARGFALNGDNSLLQTFEPARKQAIDGVELARHLTEDNPAQQLRVAQLAQEIAATIDTAKHRIAARRETGKALSHAELLAGEIPMDSVRATSRAMQREEEKLLEQRSRETARLRESVKRGTILSVLPSLAFYLLAWIAASRALKASARSRQTASGLFSSLERRVAESTAIQAALDREQAKLRASEEQSQLLLDGVVDYAICMLDAEGRVVSWNTGASKIMGYGSDEILGKPSACFYVPEQQASAEPARQLQIAIAQGRFEGEGQRIRKSGEVFWANVILAAMYDSAGVLRGFSKVVRDVTSQKQADAALNKQSALLDLAPDAIFARDIDNRIIYWNRGAEKLYGWPPEQAIGKVTHELLHTRFPTGLAVVDTALMDQGEWEGELVHTTRLGSEVPTACRWSLQRDDRGAPMAILEINRDITERRKAERELHTLASIVQNSKDFIGLWTSDMKPLFVNQSGMEMVGLETEAEMRHTALLDYFWPGDREQIEAQAIPLLQRDGSWRGEVRFRHFKTGQPIHTVWDAFVIRDEQGQTVAWASISPNLERMKLLQTALAEKDLMLRESQAQQAGIIDSAMDAIITVDAQQQIVVFNAAAERLFLCPAAEAMGKTITRFIPRRFHSAHGGHIRRFGETGVTSRAMGTMDAIWAVRTNGEEFEIEASISQVVAGGQRLFTVIMRDVTQRKASEREVLSLNEELEERVKQRTAELQASNQELESFTYAVAHDLRAPLRQVAGFCGILLDEHSSGMEPAAQTYLQRVKSGASRMGLLVDELLRFSKVGRQAMRREIVNLNKTIADVVGVLEPEFEGRSVDWRIGRLTPAACDPTLIRLVFQNLISNALKYSRNRTPPVIEIGQIEESGFAVVFVRDNGVGFDMKYADKLFGVFQRLHSEQEFEGTGVGLATVHRIVTKHAGRIWVEAEVDRGATFFFTLGVDAWSKTEPVLAAALVSNGESN